MIIFIVLSTKFVVICYNCNRKLIQGLSSFFPDLPLPSSSPGDSLFLPHQPLSPSVTQTALKYTILFHTFVPLQRLFPLTQCSSPFGCLWIPLGSSRLISRVISMGSCFCPFSWSSCLSHYVSVFIWAPEIDSIHFLSIFFFIDESFMPIVDTQQIYVEWLCLSFLIE